MTDPIADLLTRIRNDQLANNLVTSVPYSKTKEAIVKVLVRNKFLVSYEVDKSEQFPVLKLILPVKTLALKRVSKPGQRIYVPSEKIYRVLNGLGIAVISTSKGIMTGYEARKLNIGGELLCTVS